MGAEHLTFPPKFAQNGGFQPQIWHFWTNIFQWEDLWQFVNG